MNCGNIFIKTPRAVAVSQLQKGWFICSLSYSNGEKYTHLNPCHFLLCVSEQTDLDGEISKLRDTMTKLATSTDVYKASPGFTLKGMSRNDVQDLHS